MTEPIDAALAELVTQRLGLRIPPERREDLRRALEDATRHAPVHAAAVLERLRWLAARPEGSPEWGRLASRLTVAETYFFRDDAAFEALADHVLPALIAEGRRHAPPGLRIWSAGCATGEEPYSLAILLDRLIPDRAEWAITLLATDVGPEALAAAAKARYRNWSFRATPEFVRTRWFHPCGEGLWELDEAIRSIVSFAPLNLAGASYPSALTNTTAFDLVVCRNVLIYFEPDVQHVVARRLGCALAPGGWLLTSPVEASTAVNSSSSEICSARAERRSSSSSTMRMVLRLAF